MNEAQQSESQHQDLKNLCGADPGFWFGKACSLGGVKINWAKQWWGKFVLICFELCDTLDVWSVFLVKPFCLPTMTALFPRIILLHQHLSQIRFISSSPRFMTASVVQALQLLHHRSRRPALATHSRRGACISSLDGYTRLIDRISGYPIRRSPNPSCMSRKCPKGHQANLV